MAREGFGVWCVEREREKVKATTAGTNERVKRERGKGRREKRRRRLVKLTKTGSTGFAAACIVKRAENYVDYAENLPHGQHSLRD
jgi:hypothetical protein